MPGGGRPPPRPRRLWRLEAKAPRPADAAATLRACGAALETSEIFCTQFLDGPWRRRVGALAAVSATRRGDIDALCPLFCLWVLLRGSISPAFPVRFQWQRHIHRRRRDHCHHPWSPPLRSISGSTRCAELHGRVPFCSLVATTIGPAIGAAACMPRRGPWFCWWPPTAFLLYCCRGEQLPTHWRVSRP